ncbi:MAG: HD-GYP domain-containing protein [Bacillota bacterium]|nr:HD-GYP domain-containing protein [Bacillota bacterium]
MDEQLPRKALIYIALIVCASATIIAYTAGTMDWTRVEWFPILVFLLLIIFSDAFPVTLPRGGSVTVSFATIAASILLFQPLVVIVIAISVELFMIIKEKPRVKHVFNAAQLTISTGVAALIYNYLTPTGLELSISHVPAFIISMIIFFLLNSSFVTLVLALVQGEKPYSIWLFNIKWCTLTFLSMAPLGGLIAVIYINIGFWGLVLFLLPLILARHSFQSYMNMRQTFLDTIKSLSVAIDAKDPYTKGHSSRVADYVVSLARELKWPEDRVEFLQYIALIHDVGKVAVPEDILKKSSLLSREEFAVMKTHSEAGANILKEIKYFSAGADIIRHHHERWDGNGYPDKIAGEEIPEGSRILAVADTFDAMTSDRPYRKSLSSEVALRELQDCAGTQFDPKMVNAFIKIYPQIKDDLPEKIAEEKCEDYREEENTCTKTYH